MAHEHRSQRPNEQEGSSGISQETGVPASTKDIGAAGIEREGTAIHPVPPQDRSLRRGRLRNLGAGQQHQTLPPDEETKRDRNSGNAGPDLTQAVLSKNDLFEMSVPINDSRFCGLYFLFSGDEIVYVGQSTCYPARLGDHIRRFGTQFNRITFLPTPYEELYETECLYILEYRPHLNTIIPKVRRIAPTVSIPHEIPYQPSKHDDYLSRPEASDYLTERYFQVSPAMLAAFAKDKTGPAHCLASIRPKKILPWYLKEDLDHWVKGVKLPSHLMHGEEFW